MNKVIIFIIVIIALGGITFWAWFSFNQPKIILFYGQECPHCKDVDDYIVQNKIEEKVRFRKLEVWHDQGNANLLLSKAIYCKIDTKDGVAVPFLYDGKNCLIGTPDIINFFKNEAGIK